MKKDYLSSSILILLIVFFVAIIITAKNTKSAQLVYKYNNTNQTLNLITNKSRLVDTEDLFQYCRSQNVFFDNQIIKENVKVVVVDNREFPLIIGKRLGPIRGTKIKVKDKSNKWFLATEKLINQRFTNIGFPSNTFRPEFVMTINIKELFFNERDNFVSVQTDQILSGSVTIVRNIDNFSVYNYDYNCLSSSTVAKSREYCRLNGYKWTKPGSIFLYVIDELIRQLMEDEKFLRLFEN